MKYCIAVQETLRREIVVEADSLQEALDHAEAIDDMLEHLAYALVGVEVPEQNVWYIEKWYDEDLKNALKEAGVIASKKKLERLKSECLHLFDDKSARNEMLIDKAREIFGEIEQ